jgi:hypothetical protein
MGEQIHRGERGGVYRVGRPRLRAALTKVCVSIENTVSESIKQGRSGGVGPRQGGASNADRDRPRAAVATLNPELLT